MDQERMQLLEYKVGLNLFNKGPPETGIRYLINKGFINLNKTDSLAAAVAHFMIVRQGLSKERITEYLLDHRKQFNMLVLDQFASQQDLKFLTLDEALRKLMQRVRIQHYPQALLLLQAFTDRYVACNPPIERLIDGGER